MSVSCCGDVTSECEIDTRSSESCWNATVKYEIQVKKTKQKKLVDTILFEVNVVSFRIRRHRHWFLNVLIQNLKQ